MKDLMLKDDTYSVMLNDLPEHKEMLDIIKTNMPALVKQSKVFGKHQSQYMDNFMTVSHPTELRNARQILAEIEQIKLALREAFYNNRKKQLEVKKLLRDQESLSDEIDFELNQLEADKLYNEIETTKLYISGAVRKLTNYINQYKSILAKYGKDEFTEQDFEDDEERYHIMTAFNQALIAARSRGGIIDEGNHIYLSQIGVNGATAQHEITRYLNEENKLIYKGKVPSYEMQKQFLEDMYEKFKGSVDIMAKLKGQSVNTQEAILR